MKQWIILGTAGLLMLGCQEMQKHGGEDDEANEVKVKFTDAPAAVQATLTKAADGKMIDSLDKEMKMGKPVYEADVMMDGKNYEIKVAEDGTLMSKKLDMEDVKNGKAMGGKEEKDEKDEK